MVNDSLARAAKNKLEDLAEETDKRLEKFWESETEKNFGFNETQRSLVQKMLGHAKEHNLRSAKRVRASFVYYGYLLGQKTVDERVWKAAEAVEIVHTALLMHDDFMDKDKIRRGKPTTQVFFGQGDEHYGESMAVNTGDAVLCLGYERLLTCGFEPETVKKALKQMLRGVTNTAYGQAYDVSLAKLGEITEEKVMGLHRAKTAIYTYENPLFVGAILAGLTGKVLDVLHDYAMDGGVAFQLQDDILGIFGDEGKTGKSADSDLLQGKVTLLMVKVMERGNEEQRRAIQKVWGKPTADKKEVDQAKVAMRESGAYNYSLEVARSLAKRSAESAVKLRSLRLNDEAIDYLEGIARYMVEREV